MSKARVMLAAAVVIIGAVLFWQERAIGRLKQERADLMNQAALLRESQDQKAHFVAQGDPAELARLRAEHAELLRLRHEVSELRRRVNENAARSAAPARGSSASTTQDENPAPEIETFCASTRVTLGWKQTVATGGWTTGPGQRTLFFIQPQPIPSNNGDQMQVLIQARVLEISDDLLPKFGLAGLGAGNTEKSLPVVFSPEQSEALINELAKTEGVNILSAPRIQTSDGVQANLKSGPSLKLPSGETYQLGNSLGVLPKLSPDGSSVVLTISSEFSKPKS